MATGVSLSGYVRSMTGATCPDSMRSRRTIRSFEFSEAMTKSGIVWDETTLADYNRDPHAKVPGTKMVYAGLKDEQKIKDLLAFLKQFGADGKKTQ